MAGISHAQVSRIENNKSKVSIITLARLFHALDISFSSIFTNLEIQVNPLRLNIYNKKNIGRGNSPEYPCINFNDIELLDAQGIISSGKIKEVTISLLQQYIQKFDTTLNEKSIRLLAELYYRCLGRENELALMVPGLTPSEMPSPMEYIYPREFSGAKLRQIYLSGGCLIFLDIGMYVRQVRLSQDLSLRELGKNVGISHQGIKFIETRTAEKLIFDDLVKLDQALSLGGDLIAFAWRATEIYTGAFRVKGTSDKKLHAFPPDEILEVEKLIMASRFFQYFLPDDPSWLEWLRKISLSGVPVGE
jgi:transcriptional regulator with XRE-family HTH domain